MWQQINFISGYWVSKYGEVKNKRGHILKSVLNKGYPQISIKGKSYRIHTLVAKMFIPNPENKATVNHKDGNKLNNTVENLEWMSFYENKAHATKNGLVAKHENHNKAKLNKSIVLEIRERRNKNETCKSIAEDLKMSKSTISRISLNKLWIF